MTGAEIFANIVTLTVLVFDGLAEMQRIVTDIGGRQRTVAWMKITPTGREATAE